MYPVTHPTTANLKTLLSAGRNTPAVLDEHFGAGEWLYIGRANRSYGLEASALANPFTVAQYVRDEAITRYRAWLWCQIQTGNPAILTALRQVSPTTVFVCWCHPDPCHAEVIFRAVAWLRAQPQRHIVVAGSRTFSDYEQLRDTLDQALSGILQPVIISGMARGADALGCRYAAERGLRVVQMPARWESDGKQAGYRRNERMGDRADQVICFWDGQSRGTRHMIELAQARQLPVTIVRYSKV